MESILINGNFINFLIFIGFPILILKIFSLTLWKILSYQKFETFFIFSILSIIEIIFSTIYFIQILISPNISLILGVIIFLISINLLFLFQNSGITIKNKNSWKDFWFIIFITIAFWIFLIVISKLKYF